ncbi:MAG: hypothetical protein KAT16_04790 [Candidatus Heimdallarchaeota archaeon]|nr:hypothetical protein [Candidatus Heimdallarchaeota archaeon]
MINSQPLNTTNLDEVLKYLKYQGPLYLRRLENIPPTPGKISPISSGANSV